MASKPVQAERRSVKLDLRVSPSAKATLQAAASTLHRNMSDFVLDAALSRAQEALSERRVFSLSAERWKEFVAALDAPIRPMPRMKKLLVEPGYFDAPNDK